MSKQKPALGAYREPASLPTSQPDPIDPHARTTRARFFWVLTSMLLLGVVGVGHAGYLGHQIEQRHLDAASSARTCLFGADTTPAEPVAALRAHQLQRTTRAEDAARNLDGEGWPRSCVSALRQAASANRVDQLENGKYALLELAKSLATGGPFDTNAELLRMAVQDLDTLRAPTSTAETIRSVAPMPSSASYSTTRSRFVPVDTTPRVHALMSLEDGESYRLCSYDDDSRSAICERLQRSPRGDYVTGAASALDLTRSVLTHHDDLVDVVAVEDGSPVRLWFRSTFDFTALGRIPSDEGPLAVRIDDGRSRRRIELDPRTRATIYSGRVLWDQLVLVMSSETPTLLARPARASGAFHELGQVLRTRPPPDELYFSHLSWEPSPIEIDSCTTNTTQLVRFHAYDGLLLQRTAAGALQLRNRGPLRGHFTCDADVARFVEVDLARGLIVMRECSPSLPCGERTVTLEALHRGSHELQPESIDDIRALALGGTLVVVWRSPSGGVRLRAATPEQLGASDDVLIMDDHLANGDYASKSTLLDLDLRAGARSAVLTLTTLQGAYALRIDPSGAVEPWRVVQQ